MTRITLQKPKRPKAYPAALAGGVLVIVAVFALWAFQFWTALQHGAFDDLGSEFAQTSEQIQTGIDLVSEAAQFPESPADMFGNANAINGQANDPQGQLPISE